MVDPSLGSWQFKPVKEFLISKIEGPIDPTQIQRSINKTLRPLADPKQLSTKHSGRFGQHSLKNGKNTKTAEQERKNLNKQLTNKGKISG